MYLTENWRLKNQRYTLRGTQNTQTHEINFPPRRVAPREVATYDLNQSATGEALHTEKKEIELIHA